MSTLDASASGYPPIGDYAAIGNCRVIALVSRSGSIDWLCLPHFSSPSLFAALLDRDRGGRFEVRARAAFTVERQYMPGTNVLVTLHRCDAGVLRVTDFMTALPGTFSTRQLEPEHELVRIVECVEGEATCEALYAPRPDYARHTPRLERRGKLGWACAYRGMIALLTSDLDFHATDTATIAAAVTLKAEERRQIVFSYSECDIAVVNPLGESVQRRLDATASWWRAWCARCATKDRTPTP